MNSKLAIASAIAAIFTAGIIYLPAQAQDDIADLPAPTVEEAKPASKWQHLAVQHDATKPFSTPELARRINNLGEEGWEIVNVLNFHEEGTTTKTVYYFKRPL